MGKTTPTESTAAQPGDTPPPYPGQAGSTPGPAPENTASAGIDDTKTFLRRTKLSHVWFLFWNLATLALTICVLSGCGTPASTNYSLFGFRGNALAARIGYEECKFCDFRKVQDAYMFGLSGKAP